MQSTTPESQLPSIKECTYIMARCSVNNHTVSDDLHFGPAPGECMSRASSQSQQLKQPQPIVLSSLPFHSCISQWQIG